MPCRWRGCGGRWQPPCARCVGDALGPKLPQEHPCGPGCPRQGELSFRKPWQAFLKSTMCVLVHVAVLTWPLCSCWRSKHRSRVCGVTTYILQKGPWFLNACNKDVDVTGAPIHAGGDSELPAPLCSNPSRDGPGDRSAPWLWLTATSLLPPPVRAGGRRGAGLGR